MANEFVARRGIVAQSGGAKITGSLLVSGNLDATGYSVSASAYTGSFSGSFKGDGSQLTGLVTELRITGSDASTDTIDLLTGGLTFAGNNGVTTTITNDTVTIKIPDGTVSSSGQVKNYLPGGSVSSSTQVQDYLPGGSVSSSGQVDITQTTGYGTFSSSLATVDQGQQSQIDALIASTSSYALQTQLAGVASSSSQVKAYLPDGTVSSSAQYPGWVTASSQVDITATSGYSTFSSSIATKNDSQDLAISTLSGVTGSYATTGSNNFVGVQTISNTTNSVTYADGALIVQGGVGIAKDVNISGSLNVLGLLTVTSQSTQYVTSSTYDVGTNKITVNTNEALRFGGISVNDSGSSTLASGSLYWDSYTNHWIYENASGSDYNSAIIIAGPKNTGTLGNEVGLITGRIPVASGDDHIDTNPSLTPLRVAGTVLHVEDSLYATGSITASAFSGDGSQLTGIVTTLYLTGSDASTGTVNLKTQALTITGDNGITTNISGQTVTVKAPLGTVSSSGQVKSLLPDGTVSSSAQYPGWVTASSQVQLASITGTTFANSNFVFPQQLTVNGVLSGSTSAYINNTLYSGSSPSTIIGPVANQVVATLPAANYDASHFDYVVKDGTNYRTGTVMAVWDGANVEFTDTSTNDIGNTSDVVFTVDISSGLVRLKITTGASSWTLKTAIRAL